MHNNIAVIGFSPACLPNRPLTVSWFASPALLHHHFLSLQLVLKRILIFVIIILSITISSKVAITMVIIMYNFYLYPFSASVNVSPCHCAGGKYRELANSQTHRLTPEIRVKCFQLLLRKLAAV